MLALRLSARRGMGRHIVTGGEPHTYQFATKTRGVLDLDEYVVLASRNFVVLRLARMRDVLASFPTDPCPSASLITRPFSSFTQDTQDHLQERLEQRKGEGEETKRDSEAPTAASWSGNVNVF